MSTIPSAESEQQQLVEQFARHGFLTCRQVLPRDQVMAWSERYGSSHFFKNMFEELYRHGHTPFPQHGRRRNNNNDNNNTPPSNDYEYALGRGVRHGFREIVMRSPGRYEIVIPEEEESSKEEATTTREHLLATVRQSLPWIPQ